MIRITSEAIVQHPPLFGPTDLLAIDPIALPQCRLSILIFEKSQFQIPRDRHVPKFARRVVGVSLYVKAGSQKSLSY